MQFPKGKGRNAVLWGLGIVVALFFFSVFSKYHNNSLSLEDTYKNIIEKKERLSQMRIHLHKSVEMEKNAVMALTDEQSREFADQSRAAAATVEQNLKQLRALIDKVSLPTENKLIVEFTQCWMAFGELDQSILELAVQNTNLKAASLSREKGAETLLRFEHALENIKQPAIGTPDEGSITLLLDRALIAGLKIYNLHSPHIAEANDEKMDRIEAQMKTEADEVALSLDALNGRVGEERRDALLQAKAAFTEFMAVNAEVIRLSRQNSNIKSLELSLGRKRKVTAQCDEVLATFQEVVQSRTFKATR